MNVTAKIDRADGDKFRKVDDAKLHSVGGGNRRSDRH